MRTPPEAQFVMADVTSDGRQEAFVVRLASDRQLEVAWEAESDRSMTGADYSL